MHKVFIRHVVVLVLSWGLAAACARNDDRPRAIRNQPSDETGGLQADFTRIDAPDLKLAPVCNEAYLPTVKSLLRGAQSTIDIFQFELNEDDAVKELFAELIAAVKRGVEVRVMAEDSLKFNRGQVAYLNKKGIRAKLDSPNRKLHSKMVLVDGNQALIGSTNWSYMSILNNNETNILIEGEIVKTYQEYYSSFWDHANSEKIQKRYDDRAMPLLEKDYFRYVKRAFTGAQSGIDVLMYGTKFYNGSTKPFFPDGLIMELAAAHRRGVPVRVIFEQSNFSPVTNGLNRQTEEYLESHGVTVKWDPVDRISHAKLVIVDNTVVVGSANWGLAALRDRVETNLAATDPAITESFRAYFQTIWDKASDNLDPTATVDFSGESRE